MKSFFKNALKKSKTSAIFLIIAISVLLLGALLSVIPYYNYNYGYQEGFLCTLDSFDLGLAFIAVIYFVELGMDKEGKLPKALRTAVFFMFTIFSFIGTVRYIIYLAESFFVGGLFFLLAYLIFIISGIFMIIYSCGEMQGGKIKLTCFILNMCACLFILIAAIIFITNNPSATNVIGLLIKMVVPTCTLIAVALCDKAFEKAPKQLKDSTLAKISGPTLEDKISALKLKLELGTITQEEYAVQVQNLLSNI